MKNETDGKAYSRRYFYRDFVFPTLSSEELVDDNFFIMAGDSVDEINDLLCLGVRPGNITSTERDLDIYRVQKTWELDDPRYAINLKDKPLVTVLKRNLHSNQKYRVLNLDICGQYIVNIDPAMSYVFLFCMRKPRTVVATYSIVGRDRQMIQEGILSYVLFASVWPKETKKVLRRFARLYTEAGFDHDAAMLMVWRHFAWLRGMLEQMANATALFTDTDAKHLTVYQERVNEIALKLAGANRTKPLRLSDLDTFAATQVDTELFKHLQCQLEFSRLYIQLYQAGRRHEQGINQGYWQTCYFTTFSLVSSFSFATQIKTVFEHLLVTKPDLVDINGDQYVDSHNGASWSVADNVQVVETKQLFNKRKTKFTVFKPRQLKPLANEKDIRPDVVTSIREIRQVMAQSQRLRRTKPLPKTPTPPTRIKEIPPVDTATKDAVKKLTRNGFRSDEIMSTLEIDETEASSVRAVMANETRNGDSEDIQIKRLALDGYTADEIITETGTKLDRKVVIAKIGVARRLANRLNS